MEILSTFHKFSIQVSRHYCSPPNPPPSLHQAKPDKGRGVYLNVSKFKANNKDTKHYLTKKYGGGFFL